MAFDYSKKLTNPVDYPTVPQDEQHARQQFQDLFDEIKDEHNNLVDAVDNLSSDAEDINYDNSQSGLAADNVQAAIDEIKDVYIYDGITWLMM